MPTPLADFERQFRRAGLPRFISGFTAWEDVFTRASPWLVILAVAEVVLALNASWPLWANILTIVVGLAIVFGGLVLLSRRRTGRWSLLPGRVGRPEVAFFLVIPPLIQLAAGGQWETSLLTLTGNATFLGLAYVVTAFGVVSTAVATLTRAAGELAAALGRLVRTLPFLLIFAIVLFINAEMWQVFATMSGAAMAALAVAFALLMGTLVSFRLPSLAGDLERDVRAGDPDEGREPVVGDPLTRAERGNIGIVLWVSQLTQVIAVSAGMGLFFCMFGMLTVSDQVLTRWVGAGLEQWSWHLNLGSAHLLFTNIHLRVAFAISAITGVYYAVTVMADASYRREFLSGLADELAPVFAARTAYRTELARPTAERG